ncbi:Fic family protein [Aggregatibacter actinomycetemcomitans]|uniref:Fic family protein n=1 Tax=Aggregatibacter actinomycetemcomitans TaxID=714 RepID=UPI0006A6F625|nr:Fic family protein [Aggregatibacter actinomycetemcomitans]KOE66251.1 cell filamentation protein [Aggregatibacter actinomycetemcomitans serotype e str. SCC393]KOE66867.1 cell filamentation protein [Aggregatibacter actinomycetemcomitans serotype e str. A160]
MCYKKRKKNPPPFSTQQGQPMTKDPFAEYIRHVEASKKEKGYAWKTAIGLQDVDGLKPSRYLIDTAIKNIEGEISLDTAEWWIGRYYEEKPRLENDERTEEADKVSVRIAKLLSEPAFSFNATQYLSIHKYLFNGIYSHAGQIRTYNITKKEWVLEGATVSYGSASELKATLEYDLAQERNFSYKNLLMNEVIEHLAIFIARLWQIHVFEEGNTRTTAVFFIKYLKTLGFDVTNDIFAEHSWYFRNALVRANYNNLAHSIHETTEYIVLFLRNLLLNENHLLSNRLLHINRPVLVKKQDIQPEKQDIQPKKQDIENLKDVLANQKGLSYKTISHIEKLYLAVGYSIFSRADLIAILTLTASPSSDLLGKMLKIGIIKKVEGQGKGKYQFI